MASLWVFAVMTATQEVRLDLQSGLRLWVMEHHSKGLVASADRCTLVFWKGRVGSQHFTIYSFCVYVILVVVL